MIICLACGNCTDNNTCEVCGIPLVEESDEGLDAKDTVDKSPLSLNDEDSLLIYK